MRRLTTDQVKTGFIGLGNMGSRIAQRLLDHGYHLSVYDTDLAKAEAIAAQGGSERLYRACGECLLGPGQEPSC